MLLSSLTDFPDDALNICYESTIYKMMERLKKAGVSRVYLQYYGNREYGYFWDHCAPSHRETIITANNMPEFSKVFVEAALKNGLDPVAVMRPQEQGLFLTYSPYYKEARENPGIEYTGGKIMIASKFLLENPDLRIKRRSYDIDPNAIDKVISKIEIYKQNNIDTRIKKENITIYVSSNNSHYKEYEKDFTLTYDTKIAEKDVSTSSFKENYPLEILTKKGDVVKVLKIQGLDIKEQFVAIGVKCNGQVNKDTKLINTAMNTIKIFDKNNIEICASPGSAWYKNPTNEAHIKAGFNFDDGFGEGFAVTLDPDDEEGYIAIAKGKNEYVHGALCVLEPKVQEYWLKWLDKAIDDGYSMIGNRIECHSVHVDEPYAYGYNDCIKEEYYKRYGQCTEEEMKLSKIAKIRGDAYTELFVKAAKRVRERGKKVYLTLNVEMLYDPIPQVRHCAYPMNVEWQWERWLDQIKPDEINIRSYCTSVDFILNDPQCKNFINKAKEYNVPLTLERYDYWDFAKDFKVVRDTGIFDRMTLYETNNIIKSDRKGGIIEVKPELLKDLEALTKK